jgi:hypothetical protein
MIQSSRFYRTFRLHVLITIIALILEYILGMYTNLLVKFPDTLVNGNAWEWSMSHNAIVMAHVLLGTLLLLISLSTLGFAIALKNKAAITTAVTGIVMILAAYLSGSIFLGNIEVDAYSFSMSLGFLGAVVTYGLAYYLTRPTLQITS